MAEVQGAMINRDSIVTASTDQVSCDMLGQAAILDLRAGQYYGLNPIGSRIWGLIQEPKPVSEILSVLVNEYEVDAERCETDLFALLRELEQKGLIEIADEKTA